MPFDFFLYDSSKLRQVHRFATSSHIQIMVVTVGVNKGGDQPLQERKTGGEKPIDLIKQRGRSSSSMNRKALT